MNEQDTQTIERVAKAINGPHDSSIIGIEELHKLQEYRWKRQTTKPDRARCIYLARAAISAMPDTTAQSAERDALVEALGEVSKQKTTDELTRDEWDTADFMGGYDQCIQTARAILALIDKGATND